MFIMEDMATHLSGMVQRPTVYNTPKAGPGPQQELNKGKPQRNSSIPRMSRSYRPVGKEGFLEKEEGFQLGLTR